MPAKRKGPTRGDAILEGELAAIWEKMSEQVLVARCAGQPGALNESLRAVGKSPLTPLFTHWIGDNHVQELRFDEAAAAYEETLRTDPGKIPGSRELHSVALEQLAYAYDRAERFDEADAALERLAARGGADAIRGCDRLGQLAERQGDDNGAIAAYRRAAKGKTGVGLDETRERARRDVKRLQGGRDHLRPSPEALAAELARAVRRRDLAALRRLASPTHFSVGLVGGHTSFRDADEILDRIADDLKGSHTRADAERLSGSGAKRYLRTEGWNGAWLRGATSLYVVRTSRGWEWRGFALHTPTDRWASDFEPARVETNQPLSISIKCPWPAGMSFTAGGLWQFVAEMTGLSALTAIPVVGWFLFLDEMKRLSNRACGFGTRGLYYNMATTHVGNDAFAIDFTRYRRGAPHSDGAGGTAVLAVQQGLVGRATGTVTSGDPTMVNEVWIDHMFRLVIPGYGTTFFPTPYQSKYLHLAGPGLVPVSVGMYVRQGARLGLMDDTGNSQLNHLHFSIHDATLMGGMSVRPTPMDGVSLSDQASGACVTSTNVPFP
jgi:tetratricopeptide (TPR) repeat protein